MELRDFSVRFVMDAYGWIYWDISVRGETVRIHCSDVFDPFQDIVAWLAEIDDARLPCRMAVNEEGSWMLLDVAPAGSGSIRLQIRQDAANGIRLLADTEIGRVDFVKMLKAELKRFFLEEFDPEHWDISYDPEDRDDKYMPLNQRMLKNKWLMAD